MNLPTCSVAGDGAVIMSADGAFGEVAVSDAVVLGAFSEDHTSRLTKVTPAQLRRWDSTGFFRPSFRDNDGGVGFGRVYSFRDLVSLKVLNALRNEHGVSLQHLRKVSESLHNMGDSKWINTTLYVLNRRVVFDNPETLKREEVVSGQRIIDIPISVISSNMRSEIIKFNERDSSKIGKIVKNRAINGNSEVFLGTRVPVESVLSYLKAGFSTDHILREFPDLREEDVESVKGRKLGSVAA